MVDVLVEGALKHWGGPGQEILLKGLLRVLSLYPFQSVWWLFPL